MHFKSFDSTKFGEINIGQRISENISEFKMFKFENKTKFEKNLKNTLKSENRQSNEFEVCQILKDRFKEPVI